MIYNVTRSTVRTLHGFVVMRGSRMGCRLVWIIAAIGVLTLVGVLWKMKEGFGPNNLRAVGIVLIATFASLLALRDGGALAGRSPLG